MIVTLTRESIKRKLTRTKKKKLKMQSIIGELNRNITEDSNDISLIQRRDELLNEVRNLDVVMRQAYYWLRIGKPHVH